MVVPQNRSAPWTMPTSSKVPDDETRAAWIKLARSFVTPERAVGRLRAAGGNAISLEKVVRALLESGLSPKRIEEIFKFDVAPAIDPREIDLPNDDALVQRIAARSRQWVPSGVRAALWNFASPTAKAYWSMLQGLIDHELHGAEKAAREAALLDPSTTQGRRRRAWVALSELFADDVIDDDTIARITRELAPLGFGTDELDRIFEREVAPVCDWTFAAVGPWPGFDKEWLIKTIEKRGARPPSMLARLVGRTGLTDAVRPKWHQVRDKLQRGPIPRHGSTPGRGSTP
jgi:hypothetical protein